MSIRKTFFLKTRAQSGISLLTIALLLLLVGAGLAAGVAYLRAGLPGKEIAAAQRLALARADEAILGFASTHHRLPCPAATPNGGENCTLAKGYLPVTALGLDTMLNTPGTLTARYMVYRKSDADLARFVSVKVADGSTWPLPEDNYDPTPKDTELFNARNGLDMCETMRLAYKGRTTAPETSAHYKRGGASFSVAYGLALPGAGDSDDASPGSPFDGVNAAAALEMEAPDRGHDATYDDFVFVRDFPSLMSAFECQPVDYAVAAHRSDSIDAGIEFNKDVFGNIIQTFSPEESPWQETDNSTSLAVDYDKKDVVSPVTASVDAVAFSFSVIEKADKQRDSVRDSAETAYTFGIISSTTGTVGNLLSTVKLIDNTIKIGEAIAKAAACLGLCANQYVAIGFYIASAVSEGVALGFAIANTVNTIQSTVEIGRIFQKLGGESDAADQFCENMKTSDTAINDQRAQVIAQMEAQLAGLKAEADAWGDKRTQALGKVLAVDQNVEKCIKALAASEGLPPEPIYDGSGSVIGYEVKDRSAEAENYEPFPLDEVNENEMFATINEAEEKVSKLNSEMEEKDNIIKGTDVDSNETIKDENGNDTQMTVRQGIEKEAREYCAQITASNAAMPPEGRLEAAQVTAMCQRNLANNLANARAQCAAAKAEKAILSAQKAAAEAAAAEAKKAQEDAVAAIKGINPALDSDDFPYCIAADERITMSSSGEDFNYYDSWVDYKRKQARYEETSAQHAEFAGQVAEQKKAPPSTAAADACVAGGGVVQLWPIEQARGILRRVDKRGGLQ